MTKRRKKKWELPKDSTYTVGIERNGAFIRVDNVSPAAALKTLEYLLIGFRELTNRYRELLPGRTWCRAGCRAMCWTTSPRDEPSVSGRPGVRRVTAHL